VRKFQVMPEICRKISRYAGQEFHLMPEHVLWVRSLNEIRRSLNENFVGHKMKFARTTSPKTKRAIKRNSQCPGRNITCSLCPTPWISSRLSISSGTDQGCSIAILRTMSSIFGVFGNNVERRRQGMVANRFRSLTQRIQSTGFSAQRVYLPSTTTLHHPTAT
jgi:hypothetical protein